MPFKIMHASFHGANLDTLVRPSTLCEYRADVVDSSMGLLDCSGENLFPYSEDFSAASDWTARGTCTVTANQAIAPNGTLTADKIETLGNVGNDLYKTVTVSSGVAYFPSFWIRRISTSGTLMVNNPGGSTYGSLAINMSSLPSSWVLITPNSPYITLNNGFVGNGSNNGGMLFYTSSGTVGFYLWGACCSTITGSKRHNYIQTTGVAKPRLDMTATGSPVAVPSRVQGSNGNLLQAMRYDGTNDYHSIAHHNCMNIFDEDHTITVLCTTDDTANSESVLSHGAFNGDGFYIYNIAASDSYVVRYNKSGASVTVGNVTALATGQYALIQVVRSSNTATMYINGTSQGSADVTGYGIDGSRSLSIAEINAFTGDVAYVRIDREASSAARLAEERALLLGYGVGVKGGRNPW